MGRVVLLNWREARRLERTQAAFSSGTLVGVQATADGRLALVDPGPPVFSRDSVAYKSDGTQVAAGQPRFETVNGRTGVLVEEGTTNLLSAADSQGFTSPVNVTVTNGTIYTVSMTGTGSITLSGAGTGTVTASSPVTFRANGTTLTLTPNGDTGRVQVEAKPYKTTWQIGGTTRAAETLTVPTAGVLYGHEGTLEAWVYVPTASLGRAGVILDARNAAQNNRVFCEVTSDKKPRAAITKDGVTFNAQGSDPLSSGGRFIAMSWSSARLACYVDGVLVAQITNHQVLGESELVTATLGSTTTSAYHFNSFIGPLRISRRARTDQEIAAVAQAGPGGMVVDEDTTYLLQPDGALIYGRGGYRIVPPIDLTPVGTAWGSRVTWTAQGSGAQILTSLDGGQTWQQATNGGPVPGIIRGMDVTGKVLTVKQRLVAQDMAAAPVMTMSDAVVMAEPQRGADVGRVRLVGSGAGRVRIL